MHCIPKQNGLCAFCGGQVKNSCPAKPKGLGDRLEDALARLGITKERAQSVAQAVGVKDCGCAGRQAALNKAGYRLGIGTPPPADSGPTS